jgi:predicted permease
VLVFTALAGTISVLAFGLIPALVATRTSLQPSLSQARTGGGRSPLQRVFVVAQLSLSLVLLLAAGLTLRALQKANAIDVGFNAADLVTASYDLSLQNYPVERREAFRRELTSRLSSMPGTAAVTVANVAPLSGTMMGTGVSTASETGGAVEGRAFINAVGPEYFATLELPILRGRAIGAEDRRGAPDVAVVNQTLARQLWGDGDPIGKTIASGDDRLTVVGVARDSKYDEPTEDPRPFMYLSLAQHSTLDRETVFVRTREPFSGVETAVRGHVRALDPTLPVFDARPFGRVLADRADKQRGVSALLAGFGALALVLAALGLYGVMAYAVATRTREMGVRLALGASPAQVMRLIAVDGLRLALAGVVVGVVLSVPIAQSLGTLLFGMQIGDAAAFAGASTLLVAVAMAAALLPARRAARLDPIAALRND